MIPGVTRNDVSHVLNPDAYPVGTLERYHALAGGGDSAGQCSIFRKTMFNAEATLDQRNRFASRCLESEWQIFPLLVKSLARLIENR